MHFLTFYVAFLIKKCDLLPLEFCSFGHKKKRPKKGRFYIKK